MNIEAEDVSTPEEETAVSESSLPTLDDALTAALESREEGSDSEEARVVRETTNESTDTKETKPEAGVESDDEPAEKPGADDKSDSDTQVVNHAPENWPAADREAFAALPKGSQDFLLRREKEMEAGFTQKTQQAAEQIKTAEYVNTLFSDDEKTHLQNNGIHPLAALKQLTNYQRQFNENPAEYARFVVKTAGLDPSEVWPVQPSPGEEPDPHAEWKDPEIATLKQRIEELTAQVDPRNVAEIASREAEQRQQIAEFNRVNSEVTSLTESRDEAGQLKYPHYQTLRVGMGQHIKAYPDTYPQSMSDADKFDLAYRYAMRADPVLGEEYIAKETERATKEARQAEEKKRNVDRAKRLNPPVDSSGANPEVRPTKFTNLDDALKDAIHSVRN